MTSIDELEKMAVLQAEVLEHMSQPDRLKAYQLAKSKVVIDLMCHQIKNGIPVCVKGIEPTSDQILAKEQAVIRANRVRDMLPHSHGSSQPISIEPTGYKRIDRMREFVPNSYQHDEVAK